MDSRISHSQEHLNTLALSVEGARHTLHRTPCEDASKASLINGSFYLAVADGHGDAKHHLSNIGAKLAVEVAEPILRSAFDALCNPPSQRALIALKEQVEKRIRWDWNRRCKEHLNIESDGSWNEQLIAFGTTLLCCVGNEHGILGFQLGDGDIVFTKDGNCSFLFAESTELMGTVTHSLCQPYKHNQSMLDWIDSTDFEMVFLTTDGLRDCMQGDRKHFKTVIPWIQKIIQDNPETLPEWLQKISTQGNGDDISIALYSPHSLYSNVGES